MVMGQTSVWDFCHVPVTVEGASCMALVDMGSTVTLVWSDVIPRQTVLEPTTVQLCMVTGELSPMKGKGTFVVGESSSAPPALGSSGAGPLHLGS